MGHEAYDGKDDKAGKHAGTGVYAAHDDGVPKERKKECAIRKGGGGGGNYQQGC